MKVKYILPSIALSTIVFVSCQNTKKETPANQSEIEKTNVEYTSSLIVGSWEDQSDQKLHFTLFSDGKAKSDNMATLLYKEWFIKDNQLFLVEESIGNKQSSIDTVSYIIEKLNDKELTLKNGELMMNYLKK